MTNKLEQSLLEKYKKIMAEHGEGPEWAVHQKNHQNRLVKPSIPFVGKNYEKQEKKILVYASAEVLSDYFPGSPSERPWLEDERAITRHRWFFDHSSDEESYFPNIHIQPMNDGTLATAVFYIAHKLNCIENQITPRVFYEQIAVANYGKYTLETEYQKKLRDKSGDEEQASKRNVDYTQMSVSEAQEKLKASHPFLTEDLNVLRPDVIILPEKLYESDKQFFDKIANEINATLIKIYQMGPIPIHCVIPKYHANKEDAQLPSAVRQWLKNIKGVSQEKYKSVFTYLDQKV